MQLKVKKTKENATIPSYASNGAAGMDLCSAESVAHSILPGQTTFISTGISVAIPEGYVGLLFARSGLSCKKGLAPANKVGVIDSDYRGEVMVALHNHSEETRRVQPGDRIAQLVIVPYITAEITLVDTLDDTERGAGGFGSTGV